jgi:hypothetical protein
MKIFILKIIMETLKQNLMNISNFIENDFVESKNSNKLIDLLNISTKNMLNCIEKYKIYEEEEKLKDEENILKEQIKQKQKELREKKEKIGINTWHQKKNNETSKNDEISKNDETQKKRGTYNPNKKMFFSVLTCGHCDENQIYCPVNRINIGDVENFYPNKSLKDLIKHSDEKHNGKAIIDILLCTNNQYNYNKLNYEKNKNNEDDYFLKLKGENFSHYVNYEDLCNLLKLYTSINDDTLYFYEKFFQ